MAALLVKAFDAVNPDGVKDKYCYKRGDIVVEREDSFVWGRLETRPDFYQIIIKNAPRAVVKKYVKRDRSAIQQDTKGDGIIVKRRRWKFLLDKLSTEQKAVLEITGKISMTRAEAQGFMQNKNTLKTE